MHLHGSHSPLLPPSLQAAKNDLKLRTIWYHTAERKAKVEKEQMEARRERAKQLEEEKEKKGGSPSLTKEELPPGLSPLASMATASADRFFKDKGAVHVSSMETDDYLTYSIVKEFADAEVETLEEVGMVGQETIMNDNEGAPAMHQQQQPPQYVLAVDTSVYTKNRAFRLLYSRKFGKPATFQVTPQSEQTFLPPSSCPICPPSPTPHQTPQDWLLASIVVPHLP
jgi:hypothetical protein